MGTIILRFHTTYRNIAGIKDIHNKRSEGINWAHATGDTGTTRMIISRDIAFIITRIKANTEHLFDKTSIRNARQQRIRAKINAQILCTSDCKETFWIDKKSLTILLCWYTLDVFQLAVCHDTGNKCWDGFRWAQATGMIISFIITVLIRVSAALICQVEKRYVVERAIGKRRGEVRLALLRISSQSLD